VSTTRTYYDVYKHVTWIAGVPSSRATFGFPQYCVSTCVRFGCTRYVSLWIPNKTKNQKKVRKKVRDSVFGLTWLVGCRRLTLIVQWLSFFFNNLGVFTNCNLKQTNKQTNIWECVPQQEEQPLSWVFATQERKQEKNKYTWAWVTRRVGPHNNNARSNWIFLFC